MLKVYSSFFHPAKIPALDYVIPIHVGAVGKETTVEGAIRDDSGDSISEKNASYCELTGLHWIWKNTEDDGSLVGLCHYRKYLSLAMCPGSPITYGSVEAVESFLQTDRFGRIFHQELRMADIIVAAPMPLLRSIEDQFLISHPVEAWFALMAAMLKLDPKEYLEARKYFTTETGLIHANMFITHRRHLDAYCEFVFPILAETEKLLHPLGEKVEYRIYAYLAERLFPYWVQSRALTRIERPILFIGDAPTINR